MATHRAAKIAGQSLQLSEIQGIIDQLRRQGDAKDPLFAALVEKVAAMGEMQGKLEEEEFLGPVRTGRVTERSTNFTGVEGLNNLAHKAKSFFSCTTPVLDLLNKFIYNLRALSLENEGKTIPKEGDKIRALIDKATKIQAHIPPVEVFMADLQDLSTGLLEVTHTEGAPPWFPYFLPNRKQASIRTLAAPLLAGIVQMAGIRAEVCEPDSSVTTMDIEPYFRIARTGGPDSEVVQITLQGGVYFQDTTVTASEVPRSMYVGLVLVSFEMLKEQANSIVGASCTSVASDTVTLLITTKKESFPVGARINISGGEYVGPGAIRMVFPTDGLATHDVFVDARPSDYAKALKAGLPQTQPSGIRSSAAMHPTNDGNIGFTCGTRSLGFHTPSPAGIKPPRHPSSITPVSSTFGRMSEDEKIGKTVMRRECTYQLFSGEAADMTPRTAFRVRAYAAAGYVNDGTRAPRVWTPAPMESVADSQAKGDPVDKIQDKPDRMHNVFKSCQKMKVVAAFVPRGGSANVLTRSYVESPWKGVRVTMAEMFMECVSESSPVRFGGVIVWDKDGRAKSQIDHKTWRRMADSVNTAMGARVNLIQAMTSLSAASVSSSIPSAATTVICNTDSAAKAYRDAIDRILVLMANYPCITAAKCRDPEQLTNVTDVGNSLLSLVGEEILVQHMLAQEQYTQIVTPYTLYVPEGGGTSWLTDFFKSGRLASAEWKDPASLPQTPSGRRRASTGGRGRRRPTTMGPYTGKQPAAGRGKPRPRAAAPAASSAAPMGIDMEVVPVRPAPARREAPAREAPPPAKRPRKTPVQVRPSATELRGIKKFLCKFADSAGKRSVSTSYIAGIMCIKDSAEYKQTVYSLFDNVTPAERTGVNIIRRACRVGLAEGVDESVLMVDKNDSAGHEAWEFLQDIISDFLITDDGKAQRSEFERVQDEYDASRPGRLELLDGDGLAIQTPGAAEAGGSTATPMELDAKTKEPVNFTIKPRTTHVAKPAGPFVFDPRSP